MFISADVYVMKDKYGVNVYSVNLTLLPVYETSGNQVTTLLEPLGIISTDKGMKEFQYFVIMG